MVFGYKLVRVGGMRRKGVGFLWGSADHLGDLRVLSKYTEISPRVERRMMMMRWAGKDTIYF